MFKLKKKDFLIVIITGVLCFLVGCLAEWLFGNTEFFGRSLLSRFGFKPLGAIISAILALGVFLVKEHFADKCTKLGTSTITYIISMVVGAVISYLIINVISDIIDAEDASFIVFVVYVILKFVFDKLTEVIDYDFPSIGYIALFLANCVLAIFIALCYSVLALGVALGAFIIFAGVGSFFNLPIGSSTSTQKYGRELYNEGFKAGQEGRTPDSTTGYYYEGYLDGEKTRK